MKTIVIYQTKYGSTKQYAQWIAEDIVCDIEHIDSLDISVLSSYDRIIFGSYVHIGKIVDIDFISKNWNILQSKKVFLFTVSGAPAGSKVLTKAFEKGIPSHIRPHITYVQFRGRVGKLDVKDTLLMFFAKWFLYTKLFFQGKLPKYNPYAPFDKMNKDSIKTLLYLLHGK